MKEIEFLKKLFLRKKKTKELSYSEEILGSKAKRRAFAEFWREHESEMIYLLEVLNYFEGKRAHGQDLAEFRRGMSEFCSFWQTCFEEESLESEQHQKEQKFRPHF